ncbi:RHS repeat protein [Streptomyces antnestii]|uniref:RHS repeat protein n=1 Tax=Streptomyces antnestii TaxID=2494256 RepID=A0A437NYK2_9ACTN|nr:RHS repeat-associated core domain-containing protein [Streptomyces sp. San01]RVU15111.1 RHS repeat protein [Streptomyces sp. San01]
MVRWVALSLVAYLVVGLLGAPVAAAAELALAKLKNPDPVPTSTVKKHQLDKPDQTAKHRWKAAPKAVWPHPGTATVKVPARGKAGADGLPVRVGRAGGKSPNQARAPKGVRVQVLDQKTARALGINGALLAVRSLDGAKGKVDVSLDYSGFRHAFGGDWASRLTLRQLPNCALTTPAKKTCDTGRTLKSDNNTETGALSARVTLPITDEATPQAVPVAKAPSANSVSGLSASQGTVLLAATAAASGAGGDFKASSLAPSASWSAGGSSGAFTWSYNIDTSDVPGGAQPDLGLSYSSQAVDGRTAATNNQANWIGDGWSMEPGYIERRYVSCSDDTKDSNGTDKSGDQCWKKDNAVLSLGGQSNVLIKDDTSGEWRLEDDDGTKIDKLTSINRGNGDDDGEYWRVTTPDGTRYYFGYNRLPGWVDGKAETNSTWTVPVFGNQSGEPCHATAFKDSWCQQAWRWNLDYVVDPHSDAMAYYWNTETNYYGLNVNPDTGASTATVYDRGGYLDHIDYGLRSSTMYSQKAAGRVDFTVSERCLTTCTTFDSTNAKNWPDVPFDRYCKEGDECKDRYSPSFWTRKRLTKIDTSVLTGGAYKPVDTWALTHQFPSTGDGTDPALWLASITRTGHTGTGDVTLPAVTFKGQQLANRVEGATTGGAPDPVPPLVRYRVYGVNTETGGTIGVTYSAADCKAGDVPTPSTNTRRCYPVMWSPPDAPAANYEPYLDWFHTYVATQVLEADNTSGAPVKETDYSYLDGMSWGKDEDEFTKAKYLTYGDRQGFGRVQVRTGAPASDKQTLKEYRYFRGIDDADVKDHEGIAVADHEAFAGMPREEATFNGDGGALQTTTSYEPWHGTATSTQARTGFSALHAYATGTKSEKTRTAVGASWRSTQTLRTFDTNGQVLTESDLGDLAKTGDEECTTTTYAANTSTNLLTSLKEVRNVAVACDKTPLLPADLISVARYYYDGATSQDIAPTKGDVTRLDEQDDKGTGYLTTATHTYDIHGRELSDTDVDGNTTTTEYTPKTIESPAAKTETNALGHATTTEYDPARSVATGTVDANGKRTDAVIDGLGRVLKVWNPSWTKADHATQPSTEYSYTISRTATNAVTTKSLQYDGSYATGYQLYDGLLRPRETQAPAIGTANRIVTETLYDTRGLTSKTYAAYYTDGAPSATLVKAADNTVPSMTENLYDGMGQVTDAITRSYGDEKWRTQTVYGGDRTTVIPPKGGTATTTVTDVQGRTTDLIQYTNADRTASQKTTYTYGKWDEPTKVTDPAGNTWSYTFDARGQKTKDDDPDKGVTDTTYDKLGHAVTTTDARGVTLTTGYDALGRQTDLAKGSTVLAKWTYDTVAKGQPTSSTRYIGGKEYTSTTDSYSDAYQPTSSTVTIPTEAGAMAGTYTWTFGYNAYTGQQEWIKHPAVGNLPSERQTTVYGEGNLPQKTTAGSITLVNSTAHDVFSRPVRTEFGTLGKKVYKTQVYDEVTGRPTRQTTDRDLAPQRIDDTTYAYDDAGNITGITTASGQDAAKSVDAQCFTNDALGRLTEAWTAKTDCTTKPSSTTVGGPDAYWQTFGYDAIGNRTKLTDHGTGALAGADATTTYMPKAPGTGLPHAVQAATVSGGALDGQKSTFAYDAAGNTKTRTIGATTQDLTWDEEGHLATLTAAGKTTSYQYDADGNRMITNDADGSQTLTLPGNSELKIAKDGTKQGVRYYTHEGQTVAVRTSDGFSFLLADHQGTSMAAVAMTTLAITRRKQLPFGELRAGQTDAIPGTRGYIGGTTDPTGLTHLGAREYDPNFGRFISVDPVIDIDDPQQMNAYAYANNRPITASDPDGRQYYDEFTGMGYGNTTAQKHAYQKWGYRDSNGRTTKKYRTRLATYTRHMNSYYNSSYYKKQLREDRKANDRAAQLKAQAERRKKDGIFGNIRKGNFGAAWSQSKSGLHDTFGTWEGWKNRVIPAIGFGACLVVSVGLCTGIGVLGVAATFVGDGLTTGSWNYAAAGRGLAWTLIGGRIAKSLGGGWRGSAFVGRVRVKTVSQMENVTIYGYRKTIDWGATYGNISLNAGLSTTFCGAGAASPGGTVNIC